MQRRLAILPPGSGGSRDQGNTTLRLLATGGSRLVDRGKYWILIPPFPGSGGMACDRTTGAIQCGIMRRPPGSAPVRLVPGPAVAVWITVGPDVRFPG